MYVSPRRFSPLQTAAKLFFWPTAQLSHNEFTQPTCHYPLPRRDINTAYISTSRLVWLKLSLHLLDLLWICCNNKSNKWSLISLGRDSIARPDSTQLSWTKHVQNFATDSKVETGDFLVQLSWVGSNDVVAALVYSWPKPEEDDILTLSICQLFIDVYRTL